MRRAPFASPAQFTYGTAGRNILRTDSQQNFDFGVFREDQISERVKTQFRAEFFNVFNHPTFGIPQLRSNVIDTRIVCTWPFM